MVVKIKITRNYSSTSGGSPMNRVEMAIRPNNNVNNRTTTHKTDIFLLLKSLRGVSSQNKGAFFSELLR